AAGGPATRAVGRRALPVAPAGTAVCRAASGRCSGDGVRRRCRAAAGRTAAAGALDPAARGRAGMAHAAVAATGTGRCAMKRGVGGFTLIEVLLATALLAGGLAL